MVGAPEVSRMKQPDGTMSGVSQSIDAWSFGCVLSVAATWIVLGFQGLRQYDRLRQLSPANNKNGQELDRFHDGLHVLPEIGKWHDYLRGHLRPSDTTTEMVLALVENKLLRAEPVARHTLEELCEKLQELSDWAEHKIKGLRIHSRDTDPLVMRALSSIEKEAQIQRTSEPKTDFLQPSFLQINPRARASMQIKKEEMIRNKPLGQTAHRKQILEKKLESCVNKYADDEPPLVDAAHNGAITDSPTDATLAEGLQYRGRQSKPRNPRIQAHEQGQAETVPHTPDGARSFLNRSHPTTPPPSSNRRNNAIVVTGSHSDDPFTTQLHGNSLEVHPSPSANLARLHLRIPEAGSPSTNYPISLKQSNGTSSLLSPPAEKGYAMQNYDLLAEKETYATQSPPLTPTPIHIGIKRDVEDGNVPPIHIPVNDQSHKGKAPVVADISPTNSPFGDKRIHELNAGTASLVEATGSSGPSITVSEPGDAQPPKQQSASLDSITHAHWKQALLTQTSSKSHDDSPRPLPPSALDLPYDICVTRKDTDHQVSTGIAKGVAKVKGKLGIETRAPAASLVETFSDPREIVSSLQKPSCWANVFQIFVVDNGWTMSRHWPIVTFVAQTLAMNAAGLDKDGFDVKFTVDGHTHNERRLKGDFGRRKLKKALKAAWPEQKPNNSATTDMAKVFRNILKEWDRVGQPATTLLVLTDGVWSKENSDTFNKIILDIARLDQGNGGNRHFSIQFIRFGDEVPEKGRLEWLDDHLCADNNMRDIIDHCSWRNNVVKMVTGSIEVYADEQNSVDQPMLYDYDGLVGLFNAFNKGGDALLSPTGTPSRTPSRASKRLSISNSFTEDWTKRG
ncbi:uncharacterized protein J4E92_002859 [Alternaria infectoria]|uniref:uncharacterized protein n=1 Tax=Alternaria infectoria TaxID=45303 RepID=UPI00221FD26E|nr:uncharacterized protein J4E92_002859 [Alternaria infectoria]KAI4935568.1 hypothetical protein J4E92_002859 [Alternaria infectoria]